MRKKLENILFEKNPFGVTFCVILVCSLPWWIAFWPGTLQYDSCGQLLQYYGVGKMTGHHPLPSTMMMGILMDVGRTIFKSDNMGVFLYTGMQFLVQSMVLSYAFWVYKSIRIPYLIRWGSLLFYTVFPLIPNWGISYVKDTGYYISFLLLILVMIDAFLKGKAEVVWWKQVLWILSLLGMVAFRNDGRYVVGITIVVLLFALRKYWKVYLKGVTAILLFLVLVEGVYMPLRNIPSGSIREAMSVPLMQTANYLDEYMQEVTEEEKSILLSVFEVDDLSLIAEAYDTEISDAVKGLFKEYPQKEELYSYIKVWWMQFTKHPDSYVRTYLEHCDGYFFPGEKCYEDIIGWFAILDAESRSDEYLDIYFKEDLQLCRNKLEEWAYLLYEIPIVGLLYRTGTHTLTMLGCLVYLLYKKRRRDSILIIPGLAVLLICTVSPLNASVRYFLPVMATTPIYVAFCAMKGEEAEGI